MQWDKILEIKESRLILCNSMTDKVMNFVKLLNRK